MHRCLREPIRATPLNPPFRAVLSYRNIEAAQLLSPTSPAVAQLGHTWQGALFDGHFVTDSCRSNVIRVLL